MTFTVILMALVLAYCLIGWLWFSVLHALTAPAPDVIDWWCIVQGVFWPISLLWLYGDD